MAVEEKPVRTQEAAPEPPPKKRSKRKWIVIGVGVLAILGGGGFAAWTQFRAPGPEQGTAETSKKEEKKPAFLALEPFIVNLADEGGGRYLKVTLQVEVDRPEVSQDLTARLPLVRDTLLVLLSSKTYETVGTVQGKAVLKDEVAVRLNQILGRGAVKGVYFTEFVVQ